MESVFRAVRRGDAPALRAILTSAPDLANTVGESGVTPLFLAVGDARASAEIVNMLLEAGADPGWVKVETYEPLSAEDYLEDDGVDGDAELAELLASGPDEFRTSLVREAIKAGDVRIVELLRAHGADLAYRDESGYTAMLDAAYGAAAPDVDGLPLIRYLVGLGFEVGAVSSYGESALGTASRFGRFEIVAELLRAGADAEPLGWTPLHRAVATGTEEDAARELGGVPDFRAYDRLGRTALHLALVRGDGGLVDLLLGAGAEIGQASEDGAGSLSFAVEGGSENLVTWLLESGVPPEERDAALHLAVELRRPAIALKLLDAGADPNHQGEVYAAIEDAADGESVRLLLKYGADPAKLDAEGRRKLLGLAERDEDALDGVTPEEYLAHRYPREGRANPEPMSDALRISAIRSGLNAYRIRERFGDPATFACGIDGLRPPAVWCFERFGQSTTILPDGRIVLVAGEHEDSYDPDFCIYNDVAVFGPDGSIRVFGYPYAVFPPTDFHSATLVGDGIVLIGSLGYAGSREGACPVLRLSTSDFRIERLTPTGEEPGRIFGHRATLVREGVIRVEGGTRITFSGDEEKHRPNEDVFELDLGAMRWTRI